MPERPVEFVVPAGDLSTTVSAAQPSPSWLADAVVYQIFPDRFARSARVPPPGELEAWDAPPSLYGFKGGDLFGVTERLDYLADLGVNTIYLNPIFSSASNHRYHTYDYYSVDPLLGGVAALTELRDALKRRSMRLILDGVFNHTGRGFWPFHHILECGEDSPYADWFCIKEWPVQAYAESSEPTYDAWWQMPALPKLNLDNPAVREYVLDVVEHWTLFGVDGWRLDVPEEISAPGFWSEFRERVHRHNRSAYLVGEIWDLAPEWLTGNRFDGLMNYPLYRVALGFAAAELRGDLEAGGQTLTTLTASQALAALERLASAYSPATALSQLNLIGSHDTARVRTLVSGDDDAVRLAAVLQMTFPGVPCIYYGDEIGLTGEADPGCRGAFPWHESAWHLPTRDFFRRLIALRREHPALRSGEWVAVGAADGILAFARWHRRELAIVCINAAAEAKSLRLRLPTTLRFSERTTIWRSCDDDASASAPPCSGRPPRVSLPLPARSAAIVCWPVEG